MIKNLNILKQILKKNGSSGFFYGKTILYVVTALIAAIAVPFAVSVPYEDQTVPVAEECKQGDQKVKKETKDKDTLKPDCIVAAHDKIGG